MEKENQIEEQKFAPGELYVFHRMDGSSPVDGDLFGIFDREEAGGIYLESSSWDFRRFRLWHKLPSDYLYLRPANRAELQDYMFNLACYERQQRELVEP